MLDLSRTNRKLTQGLPEAAMALAPAPSPSESQRAQAGLPERRDAVASGGSAPRGVDAEVIAERVYALMREELWVKRQRSARCRT